MSDNQEAKAVTDPNIKQPTDEQQLQNLEGIRDLFARAHDYIAQAQYPGHMGIKIAEVLNFLGFQHADFRQRAETLAKQLKSKVDVGQAKAATDAVLAPEAAQIGKISEKEPSSMPTPD